MRHACVILIACALVLVAVGTASGEPITLVFRVPEGKVHSYSVALKIDGNITAQDPSVPGPIRMNMDIAMGLNLKGLDLAEDGTNRVELRFTRMTMTMKLPMGTNQITMILDEKGVTVGQDGQTARHVSWDEAGEIPGGANVKALLETPIEVTFDSRGRIIEIADEKALAERLQGVDLKQMFEQNVVFPDKPVEPGDTWTADVTSHVPASVPGVGALTLTNSVRYTFKRLVDVEGERCAEIAVSASAKPQGVPAGFQINQTLQGTTLVAVETGRVVQGKARISQDMKGKVQNTPMAIRMNASMELSSSEATATAASGNVEVALRSMRVPILLPPDQAKINETFYEKSDEVVLQGESFKLMEVGDGWLSLRHNDEGDVYRVSLNYRGEVTQVTARRAQ